MSKKKMIVLGLFALLIGTFVLWQKNLRDVRNKVHIHAGFILFENDQKVDFSAEKYMKTSPCTKEASHTEDEQLEKAHLHDGVGDVVHVHRPGAVWRDLMVNIKYPYENKKFKAYNAQTGEEIINIEGEPIRPNQSVVICVTSCGDLSSKLSQAVTTEKIVEIAKKSESCGDS